MRFSVNFSRENNLDLVVLKDETNHAEAAILPRYGALLHAFSIPVAGSPFNVIDHYRDEAQIQKELALTFKGPKLSPFPCRIGEGKYRFNNKDFEFQAKFPDGSAIHGLLYNKEFANTGVFADNQEASVILRHDYHREDAGYPYDYRCEVRYSLQPGNTLEVTTTVLNRSDTVIPIADGWHPYFQLGGKTDEWELEFHAETMVEFDDQLLPTGKLLPYDDFKLPTLINDLQLDQSFLLDQDKPWPACRMRNPKNQLTLSIFPGHSYPYLQIFTPSRRNSIAIENLSAAPNCFNNGMGLTLLEPGDSQSFTVAYCLSAG